MDVNSLTAFLPFIIIFIVFYFLLIRPQKNKQKKHAQMIEELKKGDKVVTSGGFIVEIFKPEAKFFSVKLNDDTIVKITKEFIAYKYSEVEAEKEPQKVEKSEKNEDKPKTKAKTDKTDKKVEKTANK